MAPSLSNRHKPLALHAGEWVEVRSREEILATLDDRGRLDNLPFMPEMLPYCGRRLRVASRSDKTCDPAHTPWTIRRMKDTVHLEGVRCDGAGHGGCQAGCFIWWNEAWLKRAKNVEMRPENLVAARSNATIVGPFCNVETICAATQKFGADGDAMYSCQATDIRSFTSPMSWWDPRQYVRDIRSGNLDSGYSQGSPSERTLDLISQVLQVIRVFFVSFFTEKRALNFPAVVGTLAKTPLETLGLQPGELVQVRKREEIYATLDTRRHNRGLLFDGEMLAYCGGIFRVLRRVERIIDEKTGRMMDMKNPCIVLQGVVCRSDYHRLCPRAIYHYWRENWLQRVSESAIPSCEESILEAIKKS